jgi:hypothetical protein
VIIEDDDDDDDDDYPLVTHKPFSCMNYANTAIKKLSTAIEENDQEIKYEGT